MPRPTDAPADGTDPAEGGQTDDGKLSFSELNADTVAGTCHQAFGSIAELYETLTLDLPSDAELDYPEDGAEENGGWADEYFDQSSGEQFLTDDVLPQFTP